MKNTFVLGCLLCAYFTQAQETVGLVFEDVNKSKSNGYTMVNTLSDDRVFLINNCGEIVNQWDFSGEKSVSSYLLENGNIFLSNRDIANIRDWDNNILWSFAYADLGFNIHHDIEPMPNGNFLVFVKDRYTRDEMIALGKDTSFTGENFVLDRVIEIQPVGTDSAVIVWEWKFIDHIIQDFDNTKPNFGTIATNPQLLDINYDAFNPVDYVHCNGIDYNEELDQIIISARHTNEIYIIDHSTTTAEAASHTGGNSGMGGDFLWRWGNPAVYDNGTEADIKLGRQHDSKWVDDGVHKGKVSVFSNVAYGSDETASSVHIIEPVFSGGVYEKDGNKFLPNDYSWSWDGTILGETMFANSRSGAQIMSNGNALINETSKGRFTEVDMLGNVIWVYESPVSEGITYDQFEIPVDNGAFKANRYPENFMGFDDITITSSGIIENVNSISENCSSRLSINGSELNKMQIFPNPTTDILNIRFEKLIEKINVYDLSGKFILGKDNTNSINLSHLASGLYLVKVEAEAHSDIFKIAKN